MSVISMKQLLEAGVHFGHQTKKWNPKMKKYIFTDRNSIHIINLEDTQKQIDKAYLFVKELASKNANVLFVGTKKQATETIQQEAERAGMFYVNNRWLGGTLTNFTTIRSRIDRMNKLNQMEQLGDFDLLPKKEVVKLKSERDKLQANLLGIKDMVKLPSLIILVDPKNEHICIKEAKRLNIPTVGIVDTNCDPDDVNVCIPANDDAIRSVKLILNALADAIIEGRDGVVLRDMNAGDDEVSMDAVVESTVTNKIAFEKEEKAEASKTDTAVRDEKPAKKAIKTDDEEVVEEKENKKATKKQAETTADEQ